MAERARLESVYTSTRIGGSNPPLTAIISQRNAGFVFLCTQRASRGRDSGIDANAVQNSRFLILSIQWPVLASHWIDTYAKLL